MLTLVQAVERLLAADKILLLCHKNPDGDTVGSASALLHALRAQGKTVGLACSDPIPSRYDHMQVTAFAGEFEPEYIVAVDVAGLQLFGPGTVEWAQKSNLCIDHHASHSHYADGLVLDGTAAACAEIMYKLLLEMGTEITPLIADCLYTGVATDTGCFKFANVTPETHKIAAALMECGAHHTKLNAKLFESKSRSQLAVERQILRNMDISPADLATVVTAIGNHDEGTGVPVDDLSAALILADKSDVRRSRVRNQDKTAFDIHDRVNYSVKQALLKINEDHTNIKLKMHIDTKYGSIMDYFEIFLTRMNLCRRAARKLGLEFKLIINEQTLL